MKIGILGQRGGWQITDLQEALAGRGLDAPCFPITQLTARLAGRPWLTAARQKEEYLDFQPGVPLESYDILFVRTVPGGSLEQVIFRVDLLHRLENAGVRVVNSPTTLERTVNKYYTSSLLEDAGLPTPRTIVTEQFNEAMTAFEELGGDVVLKPLFGSEGRGITRISDVDTAYRVFRALELGRYVYYLQEYIEHKCQDIRVFVIGSEVVAAMIRQGNGWKTNVAQGAKATRLEPDATLRHLSLQAAQLVAADYAGVDILPLENGGYTIIEVNGIPAWRGLQAATGVDVVGRLLDYIL